MSSLSSDPSISNSSSSTEIVSSTAGIKLGSNSNTSSSSITLPSSFLTTSEFLLLIFSEDIACTGAVKVVMSITSDNNNDMNFLLFISLLLGCLCICGLLHPHCIINYISLLLLYLMGL